jgi:hypothetical protein
LIDKYEANKKMNEKIQGSKEAMGEAKKQIDHAYKEVDVLNFLKRDLMEKKKKAKQTQEVSQPIPSKQEEKKQS